MVFTMTTRQWYKANFRRARKKFSLENDQLMKDMRKDIVSKDRQRMDAALNLICKGLGNEKSYQSVLNCQKRVSFYSCSRGAHTAYA